MPSNGLHVKYCKILLGMSVEEAKAINMFIDGVGARGSRLHSFHDLGGPCEGRWVLTELIPASYYIRFRYTGRGLEALVLHHTLDYLRDLGSTEPRRSWRRINRLLCDLIKAVEEFTKKVPDLAEKGLLPSYGFRQVSAFTYELELRPAMHPLTVTLNDVIDCCQDLVRAARKVGRKVKAAWGWIVEDIARKARRRRRKESRRPRRLSIFKRLDGWRDPFEDDALCISFT